MIKQVEIILKAGQKHVEKRKYRTLNVYLSFQKFWGGYVKELKSQGRWDEDHKDEIPAPTMARLQEILVLLQKIMLCEKKTCAEYKSLVSQLPESYKNNYHRLIQCGGYMIVGLQFARRANEGKSITFFQLFLNSILLLQKCFL